MQDQDPDRYLSDFYFALKEVTEWMLSEPVTCKQTVVHMDSPERRMYQDIPMPPPVRFVRRTNRCKIQHAIVT
jgi:hypothetical protein